MCDSRQPGDGADSPVHGGDYHVWIERAGRIVPGSRVDAYVDPSRTFAPPALEFDQYMVLAILSRRPVDFRQGDMIAWAKVGSDGDVA